MFAGDQKGSKRVLKREADKQESWDTDLRNFGLAVLTSLQRADI
jgi:hypothetical protein